MTPRDAAAGARAAAGVAQAELRLRLRDAAAAQRLLRSLAADDAGQAAMAADGPDLVVVASSPTALGLLRTLDDVLAGARAAEPLL